MDNMSRQSNPQLFQGCLIAIFAGRLYVR